MKKYNLLLCLPALVLAGVLATLNYGCGKNPASSGGENPAGESKTPAVVPVEKTSFTEVTSQLDPGGNFYMYLGTAQWLDGLSAKVGKWRQTFAAMPGLKPEDATNVNKAFDIVTRLIKDSGIEDVSGVGLSSVEIEKGVFRNKALLHHYPGKGNGFLWQLAGKEPHPLTGLDLLPADTATPSRRVVAATTAAFTFLNPHVYIDTVLLLGSIGNQYGAQRWLFAIGACLASILWFSALGFGARSAAPLMSRPVTWRILDSGIGFVMLLIAWNLLHTDLTV